MNFSKLKLKSTWEDLAKELQTYINNDENINIPSFLSKNKLAKKDIIYSDLELNKFRKNIVWCYLLNEEYENAFDFLQSTTQHDNGNLIKYFNSPPSKINGLPDNPKIIHFLEIMQTQNQWNQFLKENIKVLHEIDSVNPIEVANCPFTLLEKKELNIKEVKCFFTQKKLIKGEKVYLANWHRPRILENEYFSEESFTFYPTLKTNADKYATNTYQLDDFMQHGFKNPWMNLLIYKNEISFQSILNLIVNGYQAPAPYEWRDLYDFKKNQTESERYVYESQGEEYLFLLWILLKCDYENSLVEAIDQYPLSYALTLLIFDYPNLIDKVCSKLAMPELKPVWKLIKKRTISIKEIKILADFGKQHPDVLDALSLSLQRYEYHLYAQYIYPPYIGNKDWTSWLAGERGSRMYYFFIYHPEKLPILNLAIEKKMVPSGIGSWGYASYHNCFGLYSTLMYHFTLTKNQDYEYWKNSTQIWRYLRKGKRQQEAIIKIADGFL